jgi:hypothetical protein
MSRRFPRQNATMPDVPIYVAAITAAAAVAGATVPAITILIRDVRQAERDRRERSTEAGRQACLDLLRAAGELRMRVANAADYHGNEMATRLAEIRECDAATQLHAVSVALLALEKLTEPAAQLADAAGQLVAVAERNTNIDRGVMVPRPEFTELDEELRAFRRTVVANAAEQATAAG